MGAGISRWSGRKQKAAIEPIANQPVYKFGRSQLNRHFEAVNDDLAAALKVVTKGQEDKQQLLVNLDRVYSTAFRLDYYRLSKEDVSNLTDALYVTLPRVVEEIISDAYEYGSWKDLWESYDYNFLSVQRTVSKIVRAQMDPDYLSFLQRAEQPTEEAEPEVKAFFPELRPLTEQIDAKVKELARLWSTTNELPVAVEDRYLLDRMVERYLPDTWQMIGAFDSLPEELRETVSGMVLDQLQILTHQIGEIHQRAAGNSLDSLRTQTEFIRAQHEQRRTSNLSLETDPF